MNFLMRSDIAPKKMPPCRKQDEVNARTPQQHTTGQRKLPDEKGQCHHEDEHLHHADRDREQDLRETLALNRIESVDVEQQPRQYDLHREHPLIQIKIRDETAARQDDRRNKKVHQDGNPHIAEQQSQLLRHWKVLFLHGVPLRLLILCG